VSSNGMGRQVRRAGGTKGQEIVEGLRELGDALRAGEPLETRFTVRTYKIAPPAEYRQEGVRRVRELLAMSQAAFAAFLGVDASSVRSWEQGLRCPSSIACRLMSEIEANPEYWRKRLLACLVEPEVRGPGVAAEVRAGRPRAKRNVVNTP
jgi:putative transcriptional regulator